MGYKTISKSMTVLFLVASLATLTACADNRQKRGGKQKGGPPPEAYTVCEGQDEDAVVSITSPKGDTLNATCTMVDGKLVAVPEGHKQR